MKRSAKLEALVLLAMVILTGSWDVLFEAVKTYALRLAAGV